MAHSPIGASSMYRWEACPGSVKLSEGIESKSSSYAEEGTRAHEFAAEWLKTGIIPDGMDDETAEAVQVYVEAVIASCKLKAGHTLLVEQGFDLSEIYPGAFGTSDAIVYFPKTKSLLVFDYKHGQGIPVEVNNNRQMLYYGLGALMNFKFPVDEVVLVIVQPRCFHPDGPVRSWSVTPLEVLDFAADLFEAAKKTADPNAPLNPGDHCRFCPAAGICPEIHKKALQVASLEFAPALSYDPDKLSKLLYWLPTLEAWAKNVREFAYGEAEHGRSPPGWKLVQKRATRRWKNETDVSSFLMQKLDMVDEEIFSRSLKSPAQIEKLLTKNDKPLLEPLIIAESSGSTLAPEDDKRPALKADAKSEFQTVEP